MRVLLADDHALFRAGLASLLTAWGLDVVGQASNGEEAIAAVRELEPDLVFMDIGMPIVNGLAAARAIKADRPAVKIVMLTVSDDEQDLFEAVKGGAEGYILKNLEETQFADLVERLSAGEPAMSPGLASKLLQEFARPQARNEEPELGADLTNREMDVLREVTTGATNREIAGALHISENTVQFHMKNILSKLHLRNRAQVAAWVAERGLLDRPGKPGK
jgi:DNA-binding NarL/FixJ family response regulator